MSLLMDSYIVFVSATEVAMFFSISGIAVAKRLARSLTVAESASNPRVSSMLFIVDDIVGDWTNQRSNQLRTTMNKRMNKMDVIFDPRTRR